jgi:RimJ/RimL family protein N-acetyltransferase
MTPVLAHTPVLETARLVLRAPVAADLSAFVAYATSARTRFVGGPKSAAQAIEKFAGMIGQWVLHGFGRFTLIERASGAPIGHAGPLQMDAALAPELTWSLWDSAIEGRGYAREAARAVHDWCFGSLGLRLATTVIHRDNAASHRIAQGLGGIARPDLPAHLGPDFTHYRFGPDRNAA